MTTEGFTFADTRAEDYLTPDDPIAQAIDHVEGVRGAIQLQATEGLIAHDAAHDLIERLDRLEWVLANL